MFKGQDATVAKQMDQVQASPESPQAHLDLASALLKCPEKCDPVLLYSAILEVREAIRLKPDHLDAHVFLGAALTFQGRYQEALDALPHGTGVS